VVFGEKKEKREIGNIFPMREIIGRFRMGQPSQNRARSKTGTAQTDSAKVMSNNSTPAMERVLCRQMCTALGNADFLRQSGMGWVDRKTSNKKTSRAARERWGGGRIVRMDFYLYIQQVHVRSCARRK